MEDNRRITVKIYGQEYTIAGDTSGNRVEEVAAYVDDMMNELAKGMPSMSNSALAVLTAVNLANDYFELKAKNEELDSVIADLRKDADHYIQLWEDAKASFKRYKEDAKNSIDQLKELQRIFNLKNVEVNRLKDENETLKQEADSLREQMDAGNMLRSEKEKAVESLKEIRARHDSVLAESSRLKARLQELESKQNTKTKDTAEIKEKYKELESSFFDIQMENIQLKNELDHLKKVGKKGKRS